MPACKYRYRYILYGSKDKTLLVRYRYVEWAKQAGITILPTWQEYVVCMGDKVDELTKVRSTRSKQ